MAIVALDAFVKHKLRAWPDQPPGLREEMSAGSWLRARPGTADTMDYPFLKMPGTNRLKTFPDGLWLCFGGWAHDPFVDIFGIM